MTDGFIRAAGAFDKFYRSRLYTALVVAIGAAGFYFEQEIIAMFLIAVLVALGWIFVEDLTHSFISLFIFSMTPLARYNAGEGFYKPVFFAVIFIAIGFILHLIFFPPKIRLGKFFIPTLLVAVSITLGGIGFLNKAELLSMPGLYYVLALGIGMVITLVIIESGEPERKDAGKFLASMFAGVGAMGVIMICVQYYKYYREISNLHAFLSRLQLGNNLSNCLLLSMPFTFYLSSREKNPLFYYMLGVMQYFALLLSLSRGGIIFGTLMFPFAAIGAIASSQRSGARFRLSS
jgi:hypothetical protein